MRLAIDAHYREPGACVAGVGFSAWTDSAPLATWSMWVPEVEAYIPGQFARRELPCILALLAILPTHSSLHAPRMILVDGYVDLGARPGLGRRVHEATGIPVIGIAKTRFSGAEALEVRRGGSTLPLFVTAAGCDAREAATQLASMAGAHRIPTLLGLADRLSRDAYRTEAP